MSNNYRKTSKLAIAGLIVSVAVPGLFFLCVLVFENLYKQLNGALRLYFGQYLGIENRKHIGIWL